MNCPACQHPGNEVIDSRARENGTKICRRRKCLKCGHRWSTVEVTSDFLETLSKRGGEDAQYLRDALKTLRVQIDAILNRPQKL